VLLFRWTPHGRSLDRNPLCARRGADIGRTGVELAVLADNLGHAPIEELDLAAGLKMEQAGQALERIQTECA